MRLIVRAMRPDEARAFLDIHARSIRGLAAPHYPPQMIDAWIVPVTDENVRGFLRNRDGEIRLVAGASP